MGYGCDRGGGVINRDQPASDSLGRLPNGVVENLRIHVQGRVDLGPPCVMDTGTWPSSIIQPSAQLLR